jgi:hypothetical protein
VLGIDRFVAELEDLKRRDHPFTISGAGGVVRVSYGINAASFTIFEVVDPARLALLFGLFGMP